MKKILLTLAILNCSMTAFSMVYEGDSLIGRREWQASALPVQGSKIIYEETVNADGITAARLFKNAVEWYNYNYKTGDTRLTTENQANGKISGTGVIKYTPLAAGESGQRPIFFNFDIVVSDGSYTYRVYDMYSIGADGRFDYADMYREEQQPVSSVKPRWAKRYRYEMLSDLDTYIRLVITHLKQDIIKA